MPDRGSGLSGTSPVQQAAERPDGEARSVRHDFSRAVLICAESKGFSSRVT